MIGEEVWEIGYWNELEKSNEKKKKKKRWETLKNKIPKSIDIKHNLINFYQKKKKKKEEEEEEGRASEHVRERVLRG